MFFIIRKGPKELPLFWCVDGWASVSYWAIQYKTREAAKKAFKVIDIHPEDELVIEGIES
jgi:hypothetical protein